MKLIQIFDPVVTVFTNEFKISEQVISEEDSVKIQDTLIENKCLRRQNK